MSIREEIYEMMDQVPDGDLQIVRSYLKTVLAGERDPFLEALMNAPLDDEPSTPEEDASAEEARQEYLRGEGRPWKEIEDEIFGHAS